MKSRKYLVLRENKIWAAFDTIIECWEYTSLWDFRGGWWITNNSNYKIQIYEKFGK